MRRIAFIGLVALGLAGVAVWFDVADLRSSLGLADQQTASALEQSPRDARPVTVAALARIEPVSEIVDVAAAIADRVELLMVKEGEIVKKGQTLAFLDSYDERRAET